MRTKIALMVLYNHKFERNIEKVKELYKGKFSHVFQLIPFYEGLDPTVIPVYGSSYYFQAFISQAYARLKSEGYSHYLVVADDMILNPKLTEDNLFSQMGITEHDTFISNLQPLQTMSKRLVWMKNALYYKVKRKGLEIERVLPSQEEANQKFMEWGIPTGPIPIKYFFHIQKRGSWLKSLLSFFRDFINDIPLLFHRSLDYPIVKAYSDILLIPAESMSKFSTYCGAFASSDLFVELAVPTSLVLCVEKEYFKTCEDINLDYGAIWTVDEMKDLTSRYGSNLRNLLNDFPKGKLFLHPIKLSKWS